MELFAKYVLHAAAVGTIVLVIRRAVPKIDGWLVFPLALFVAAGLAYGLNPDWVGWASYSREVVLIFSTAVFSTHLADRQGDRVGAPSGGNAKGDGPPEAG